MSKYEKVYIRITNCRLQLVEVAFITHAKLKHLYYDFLEGPIGGYISPFDREGVIYVHAFSNAYRYGGSPGEVESRLKSDPLVLLTAVLARCYRAGGTSIRRHQRHLRSVSSSGSRSA
jgi:hypothetical protein